MPYTMMRVEDVLFINEKNLVSLEYIFYNKSGKYYQLNEVNGDKAKQSNTHLFSSGFKLVQNPLPNQVVFLPALRQILHVVVGVVAAVVASGDTPVSSQNRLSSLLVHSPHERRHNHAIQQRRQRRPARHWRCGPPRQ